MSPPLMIVCVLALETRLNVANAVSHARERFPQLHIFLFELVLKDGIMVANQLETARAWITVWLKGRTVLSCQVAELLSPLT